jgi:uncharacterized protein involved in exopolysaccharide biosynthesis
MGEKMNRARRRAECALIAIGIIAVPTLAMATETVTYSYDAKGRLVKVERSGTVNNNVATNYAFDKADNRTNKTTTGSPNSGPP